MSTAYEVDHTMTYKGYTLEVEYDGESRLLLGHVMDIRDIISCEGESVAELELDFHNAINHYVKTLKELGMKPEKPRKRRAKSAAPANA